MYNFEGIGKTLQKKTFAREEKAKEVAGITPDLGNRIQSSSIKYQAWLEQFQKETDDVKKDVFLDKIIEVSKEVSSLQKEKDWFNDFDKAVAVMDVLLVEGSAGLTKDNFCGDDAEVVWDDFFTQKSNIKSTELPKK